MCQSLPFFLGRMSLFALLAVLFLCLPSQSDSQTSVAQIAPIEKLIKKGIAHAQRREFEEAEQAFKDILQQQPENAAAYNNLANLYLLSHKYASALKNYYKALACDSTDDQIIYLNLGMVYYLQMDMIAEKNRETREDWKACSEEAFDKAIDSFESVADVCRFLEIPRKKVAEYVWFQELLEAAAKRKNRPSGLTPGGGRSGNDQKIPVYWKKE